MPKKKKNKTKHFNHIDMVILGERFGLLWMTKRGAGAALICSHLISLPSSRWLTQFYFSEVVVLFKWINKLGEPQKKEKKEAKNQRKKKNFRVVEWIDWEYGSRCRSVCWCMCVNWIYTFWHVWASYRHTYIHPYMQC